MSILGVLKLGFALAVLIVIWVFGKDYVYFYLNPLEFQPNNQTQGDLSIQMEWQTYTNYDLGFSLKYPAELKHRDNPEEKSVVFFNHETNSFNRLNSNQIWQMVSGYKSEDSSIRFDLSLPYDQSSLENDLRQRLGRYASFDRLTINGNEVYASIPALKFDWERGKSISQYYFLQAKDGEVLVITLDLGAADTDSQITFMKVLGTLTKISLD